MRNAEIVILGAGPAGTAAAIAAAQRGLRAVIVEREVFPRHRPGETLHPGIEPLLTELGVWDDVERLGFIRHPGIQVAWGSEPRFVPYGADDRGPWLGLQAWRSEFDAVLLNRARQLGVEVYQPCAAKRVLVRGGRVAGLATDRGHVRAEFVVDAGGGRHWLAEQLRLPIHRASPPLLARYGYAEGHCSEVCEVPSLVGDARGWNWIAQVRETTYQWTRMNLDGETTDDAAPPLLRDLRPTGHVRGADVTWRVVERPSGPGYFLVGDAACVLDPASSHGVLKAVMTGIMATHCLSQLLHDSAGEQEICGKYNAWLRSWFDHDVAELSEFYSQLRSPVV